MRTLLVFPPGWMQFGPYLSLPLLRAYLEQHGVKADVLDLNIEFYDWVLSRPVVEASAARLRAREERSGGLVPQEYAKLCKAILGWEEVAQEVEDAKSVLRSRAAYVDEERRERARSTITSALNVVESGYDRFRLTLSQIIFGGVGLTPDRVMEFLPSERNIINWFYEDRVRPLLGAARYDLIGFSLPAWEQLVPALTLARAMKRRDPDTRFVVGGNFITRLVGTWDERAPHPYTKLIDFFSVFEGERSLLQLIEALDTGGDPGAAENLVFARGDRMVRTTHGSVDIDSIPTPNFDGLALERYLVPEPILPLFTSRSCPYKCSFCTIPYASSEFRSRSPANVAADLANLTAKHGTRLYTFVDETLVVPALSGLADEVIERGLDVYWYGETRFHPKIDRALAKRLFASGCRKLQFGLESSSQRVLNLMKKGIRTSYIEANIDACLAEGIAVHLFTFIGFPGETAPEARETHAFAQRMLRRSIDQYGNPYSSVGMGAFNLEVYSDVYNHPERYGVQLASPAAGLESDDIFELDYTVESGLSRQEAARLVRELNHRATFHDACEKTGRVWWHALWGNETNEDQDFVLYALKESNVEPAPAARAGGHTALQSGELSCELRRAAGVRTAWFTRDFLRVDRDAGQGAVLAFYGRAQDLAITLPATVGVQVLALLDAGRIEGALRPDVRLAVEQLLRHGLVEAQGAGVVVALTGAEVGRAPAAMLSFNPEVSILQLRPGQLELFNVTTQDLLNANVTAAWVASCVRQAPSTFEALVRRLVEQEPQLTPAAVEAVIASLVDSRVLIAKPGA
ncbi:MAG TPA: radical SAM protein [Kofleriaceae bacterium]|nr:radical SAM protein [Kofleriaceae bacterium]